jgi:hypothetical protein
VVALGAVAVVGPTAVGVAGEVVEVVDVEVVDVEVVVVVPMSWASPSRWRLLT